MLGILTIIKFNEIVPMSSTLAQLTPPPFISSRWKVRLWAQDLLGACVTYQ